MTSLNVCWTIPEMQVIHGYNISSGTYVQRQNSVSWTDSTRISHTLHDLWYPWQEQTKNVTKYTRGVFLQQYPQWFYLFVVRRRAVRATARGRGAVLPVAKENMFCWGVVGACWLKGLPEGAGDPNAGVLPPAGVCGVPNPPEDPLLFKTT